MALSKSKSTREELDKAFEKADALKAPLSRKLATYSDAARKIVPGTLDAYDRFVERLRTSCAGVEATAVGDQMPDFLLPDQDGNLVGLSFLLSSGPLVVSFNRGHWCPYCRLELRALARAYPSIAATGADLVSIVPETMEYSRRLRRTNNLPFKVLSDIDLGYALSVGLVAWVGEEVKRQYMKANINLTLYQRNDGWFLPIPATYVVGREARVKARFVDPDFRKRLSIEEIAEALGA